MQTYISVIIPAYNEEKVILDNIREVMTYLSELRPQGDFEIIVVDDGSTDSTRQLLDDLAVQEPRVEVLHHKRNFGRGRALKNGFNKSRGDFVFTLDADLSYCPDHVGKMLAVLESGQADIVLASAYHPQGLVQNVPFKRALASRLGNMLLSLSQKGDIKTLTCVVRGYTREAIESLELFSDDKDIHLEIIHKARMLGFNIQEIPARLCWRPGKRTGAKRGMSLQVFSGLVSRHLFFNFLFRPSLLGWLPLILLGAASLVSTFNIVRGYVLYVEASDPALGLWRFYYALRTQIQEAFISYFVWSLCQILLFQFMSLLFIAKQNNYQYAELFSLLSRISKRLKDLEGRK